MQQFFSKQEIDILYDTTAPFLDIYTRGFLSHYRDKHSYSQYLPHGISLDINQVMNGGKKKPWYLQTINFIKL